jgi:hypothetical protein
MGNDAAYECGDVDYWGLRDEQKASHRMLSGTWIWLSINFGAICPRMPWDMGVLPCVTGEI